MSYESRQNKAFHSEETIDIDTLLKNMCECVRSNSNSNSIHTIHTIHTIHNYLLQLEKTRGVQCSFYCSPELRKLFQHAIKPASMSQALRRFMVRRIAHFIEHKTNGQVTLNQYFIKQQTQVNVKVEAKLAVPEVKHVDYSSLSLEKLQQKYDVAKKTDNFIVQQKLAIELRKRQLVGSDKLPGG